MKSVNAMMGSMEGRVEDEIASYSGECLSGLEMVIQTGDPDYVENADEILSTAQSEITSIVESQAETLRQIYKPTVSTTPTE